MKFRLRHLLAVAAACGMVSAATVAQAYPGTSVPWVIDSTQSFLSLTIPDQVAQINATLGFPIRIRNQGGTGSVWNQGNTAAVAGTIQTHVVADTLGSISFDPGSVMFGLPSGLWSPDPATWNGSAFITGSAALQPYGNQTQANLGFGFGQIGVQTLNNIFYNLLSGAIPVNTGGGTFTSTIPLAGVSGIELDLDITSAALLGGGITDVHFVAPNGAIPLTFPNGIGGALPPGAITPIGGGVSKLQIPYVVPFAFSVGASTVTGFFAGQLVATAVIPEPSTLALAGLGAVGLAVLARRRARRR